jgi:hypothetical protein
VTRGIVCVLFDNDERREPPPPECPDSVGILSSYVANAADADRRLEAGERQRFCPRCRRYIWVSELAGHATRRPRAKG